jgi:hypothetical protein
MTGNLAGQEPWELRGANEPRLRGLEVAGASRVSSLGATDAFFASPPAGSSGLWKIQAGTSVITYATGGNTIAYAATFPGGVVGTIICAGDDGAYMPVNVASGQTTAHFKVKVYDAAGAELGAGGLYRVTWVAVGW